MKLNLYLYITLHLYQFAFMELTEDPVAAPSTCS